MRTKTLALSAVLTALGSASSLMAQTNVYSLNAVGYINVTIPPGFSIITCPLICSPDNTLNTLFPNPMVNNGNSPSPYAFLQVYQFNGAGFNTDQGNAYSAGWGSGGTLAVNPGTAIFVNNSFYTLGGSSNMSATFVGTVPQGSVTNVLKPGYNLVGSIVPVTGNLVTNSILNLTNALGFDQVLFFDSTYYPSAHAQGAFDVVAQASYSPGFAPTWSGGQGANGDPVVTNVAEGFYYLNASSQPGNGPVKNVNWVENFSINP